MMINFNGIFDFHASSLELYVIQFHGESESPSASALDTVIAGSLQEVPSDSGHISNT